MLRYDQDQDYKTLTGGIASIGIIVAIIIGFASMILDTLNLTSISTSTQIIKNVIPPASSLEINPDSPFRFAVEIWRLNLSDTKRYFDVSFRIDYQTNGLVSEQLQIPLQACTKEYFANYPQVLKGFQNLGAGGWLCPPLNTTLNLYGKYSSDQFSQYIITAGVCNNDTDPSRPCAPPQQIATYFAENPELLYFTFYFTNPQINPAEKDYKQYYFDDMTFQGFSQKLGSQSYIYFTDYTVQTDYSIWPYEHIVQDKGCIVNQQAVNYPYQMNAQRGYASFNLVKSPNSVIYKRQVQKLSSVFSFIGGMIGAVSAVLFILKMYTNLAFQFSISFSIFQQQRKKVDKINQNIQEEKQQTKQVTMNLWNFIKYYVYSFSRLVGKPCDWPGMKYADECKSQISNQLDIKLLIKRIIFIEHCMTHLIEDYQLDALQLSKPLLPSEVRSIRQKCESILDKEEKQSNQMLQQKLKQSSQMNQMQNQIKNEENVHSPSNFFNLKNKRKRKPLPHIQQKKISRQSSCSSASENEVNKQVVIEDLQNKQDENIFTFFEQKLKESGKVADINISNYKKVRRSSYLEELQRSALLGNQVSQKIWKQLNSIQRK